MTIKFKFEVTATKDVIIEGCNTKEEAREKLINNLQEYCYDIVNPSSIVSDGEEVE